MNERVIKGFNCFRVRVHTLTIHRILTPVKLSLVNSEKAPFYTDNKCSRVCGKPVN